MTNSFSGTHPFRPACLKAVLEEVLEHEVSDEEELIEDFLEPLTRTIDAGFCPRCGGGYEPAGGAFGDDAEIPSGSRLTDCRCIPVCHHCGFHEAIGDQLRRAPDPTTPEAARRWLRYVKGVFEWPIDREQMLADIAEVLRNSDDVSGVVTNEGLVLLESDGVSTADATPRHGGWAMHGYDDEADEQERRGW